MMYSLRYTESAGGRLRDHDAAPEFKIDSQHGCRELGTAKIPDKTF
jgi:hypothetical protein